MLEHGGRSRQWPTKGAIGCQTLAVRGGVPSSKRRGCQAIHLQVGVSAESDLKRYIFI